jgi:replicative DNA helicase
MEALTNIDAERTIFGCMLSDDKSVYRVLPLLSANDFFLDSHRRIYRAMQQLAEIGKPLDELTLSNVLSADRQLESVGGVAYISALTQNVDAGLARVTNVEHYTDLVIDKSRRRQARAAAECLIHATEDQTVSTSDCLQSVQEALLRIEAASGKATAKHVKEFMPEVHADQEPAQHSCRPLERIV